MAELVSRDDLTDMARLTLRAPRELMEAIPGLKVVPVTEADQCCGGAGTFAVVHAELSRKVVAANQVSFIDSLPLSLPTASQIR